jgi:hypothetical protein
MFARLNWRGLDDVAVQRAAALERLVRSHACWLLSQRRGTVTVKDKNCNLISRFLETCGMPVVRADNAPQGLEGSDQGYRRIGLDKQRKRTCRFGFLSICSVIDQNFHCNAWIGRTLPCSSGIAAIDEVSASVAGS